MDVWEKLVDDVHSKLMGLLQRAPYIRCEDVHRQYAVNWLMNNGVTVQEWISVDERIPQNFVSVLGYMTDAGEFPPVRECYTVGNEFFFPALGDVHPVSHWCELPQPPKGE